MAAPSRRRAREEPRSKKERAALAELIEVERAIAALEGRMVENAEHLVVLRHDAEKRKEALEQSILAMREQAERRRKRLPYQIAATVVALGLTAALGVVATRDVRARLAERDKAMESLTLAAKLFTPRFSTTRTVSGAEPFTVTSPEGRCFLVLASTTQGPAQLRVEREAAAREAKGSIAWCSCKAEEIKVEATGPEPLFTLVLEAPAAAVGGADVVAFLPPRPDATFGETVDRACAEAAFDAWAAAQKVELHVPAQRRREEEALIAQGLSFVELGLADVPFLVPPASSDACIIALSRGAGDALSLRLTGGERPLSTKWGGLGFCAKDVSGLSVWHEGGTGEVALFSAPRARIGGVLGLREAAARAGVTITAWTPRDELDADAHAALAAAGIGLAMSDYAGKRGAVIALSTDIRSLLTVTDAGPDVACDPKLEAGAIQATCIEGHPGAFAPVGALPPGVVRGPRPLWLALPEKPTRADLERSLGVLSFARRMSASGYELTTLVGATLTPDGLTVTGRSREKEVIAIVVSSKPPYLHTLSSGAPWTLADPKATLLVPGKEIVLRATPRYDGHAQREFVVWRR
jgi:hypothetical protein